MSSWKKIKIQRENGEWVEAQAPIIISASRSTDIPAFYADWFFHRLKIGYSVWTNPFNGTKNYVSYKNIRFVVFWSKNPLPLLKYLDNLKKLKINCYIQYTLNDYTTERLEQGVPTLKERIKTFKLLTNKLGKGLVIWRFDPLILTDKITIDNLLQKIENIGNRLQGYTEKLVFSFADILCYKKVKNNLEKENINYHEWTEQSMLQFAEKIIKLNKKWNYQLATCSEKINLNQFGIQHNSCIDDDLMIRFAYHDKELMNFLGVKIKTKTDDLLAPFTIPQQAINLNNTYYAIKTKNNIDNGQRKFCRCIVSKDIGQYNTCPHLCEYCYANTNKDIAVTNYRIHIQNKETETIV